MRNILVVLGLLLSVSVSARQYIQCSEADSYSTNGFVINLNGDDSTYFATNGVHLPDEHRILKDLFFVGVNDEVHTYETKEGPIRELINIPTEFIGKATSYLPVELVLTRLSDNYTRSFELSCFSSVY